MIPEIVDSDYSSGLSYSAMSSDEEAPWTDLLCSSRGDGIVPVDEEFLNDDFNLTGLNRRVPDYRRAMVIIQTACGHGRTNPQYNKMAKFLYGLIHARFILTSSGMSLIRERYMNCVYGTCPNVVCKNTHLLPIGLEDSGEMSSINTFCPRCNEVYNLPEYSPLRKIEFFYFGPTFPSFFLMHFPAYPRSDSPLQFFEPRICGFPISPLSRDRARQNFLALYDSTNRNAATQKNSIKKKHEESNEAPA